MCIRRTLIVLHKGALNTLLLPVSKYYRGTYSGYSSLAHFNFFLCTSTNCTKYVHFHLHIFLANTTLFHYIEELLGHHTLPLPFSFFSLSFLFTITWWVKQSATDQWSLECWQCSLLLCGTVTQKQDPL